MRRLLLTIAAILAAGVSAIAADPALDRLLAVAGARTLQYEQRFAAVVSDERYEQHAVGSAVAVDRKIESEMAFVWLEQERAWLAVRNVLSVDGRPVENSQERLDRLFGDNAPIGIARLRRLRDEGARFNIGRIRRNFNDPLLPLRFVEPANQRRFKLTLNGRESVNGADATKVAFEETARPTTIQDNGRDRPSHGMFWIVSDGGVVRTRLEVGMRDKPDSTITGSVIVEYGFDDKLQMIVPKVMREIYMQVTPAGRGVLGAVGERIECVARYSNFRRFETSARIIPD